MTDMNPVDLTSCEHHGDGSLQIIAREVICRCQHRYIVTYPRLTLKMAHGEQLRLEAPLARTL